MSKMQERVDDLQKAFKAFMRSHQFRDRNEMSPYGVTVTQCYALDALGDCGRLTMSELAEKMYLTTATITGVVDELEKKELAERSLDSRDRRLIRVSLTGKGLEVYHQIREALLNRYRSILRRLKLSGKDVDKIVSVLNELTRMSREGESRCS